MLGQNAASEAVKGAHRGTVQLAQCGEHQTAVGTRRGLQRLVQLGPHAVAELGSGLVGEGDGSDRGHRHRVEAAYARHHRHDPIHEHRGLAGARAGFDKEQPTRFGGDQVALGLVSQHHSSSLP